MLVENKPLLGFRRWNISENMRWIMESDRFSWSAKREALAAPTLKPATEIGRRVKIEDWENRSSDWQPGVNKAICKNNKKACVPEKVPGKSCHCGFNAWFSLKDATRYYEKAPIMGAIAGAGSVQMHTKGFRCAEAQIIAFLIDGNIDAQAAAALETKYEAPVFEKEEEFMEYIESLELLEKKEALGKKSISLNFRHCLNTAREISALISPIIFFNVFFLFLFCSVPEIRASNMVFSACASIMASWFLGGIVIDSLRHQKIIASGVYHRKTTVAVLLLSVIGSTFLMFFLLGHL